MTNQLIDQLTNTPLPMSPAYKGRWAKLPAGKTYYEIAGTENGYPVVLVHGFSVPSCVWDGTFEYLAQAGFWVLRYDLYGRGRSARPPNCNYGLDCYVEQLRALVDAVPIKRPFGVVGLSMGGPIAAAYATQYAHHVRTAIFIDPVVTGVRRGLILRIVSSPIFGELVLKLIGKTLLPAGVRGDFSRPERMPSSLPARYRAYMDGGFYRAIHLTLRAGMLGNHAEVYKQFAERLVPTMVVWGEADSTVPIEQAHFLKSLIPHARLEIIPDAGHLPHLEHPEKVHPLLSSFLMP